MNVPEDVHISLQAVCPLLRVQISSFLQDSHVYAENADLLNSPNLGGSL